MNKLKLANQKPNVKDLDELFREIIKKRDRICRKCGKTSQLQVAHIFSRAKRSVRWDTDNGVLLCLRHHLFWAHKNPIEFADWVKEQLGAETFAILKMRANAVSKVDLSAVKVYLLEIKGGERK